MDSIFYVYALIHPETKIPFYIGKGSGDRCYKHLKETKDNTENRRKYAVIVGLRRKGLEPTILKVEGLTEDDAYDLEAKLIKRYGRIGVDDGGVLTNVCEDQRPPNLKGHKPSRELIERRAESLKRTYKALKEMGVPYRKNYRHSEETRNKISKANAGKKYTLGTKRTDEQKQRMSKAIKEGFAKSGAREKISKALKGKPKSEEHKEFIRTMNIGRKHSEETKQKMREAHLRRKLNKTN